MRKITLLLCFSLLLCAFVLSPAEASNSMLSGSGSVGIAAMIVVVIVCTWLMKKFMG